MDPSVSDLREHLLSSYGDQQATPPGASAPNLQIHGQIGLAEEYTTNAGLTAGSGAHAAGSDFVTLVQPGLTIIDTSQRLQVNVTYMPIGQIYAQNGEFSQLEEIGNGDILFTALPGWLYVDARASISQQSVFGGVGPVGTVSLSPNERETVSNVSISPYVTRSFGGVGTAQLGVGYNYTSTDAPGQTNPFTNDPFLNPALENGGAYGSSTLTTKRVFASFVTGENYGRLQDKIGEDGSFYSGSGALAGGHRVLFTDDFSYAVSRFVTVLGQVGYEALNYPLSGYAYSGAIASGGVKLTPTKGSSLTVEYRYVDGFGSIYAQGSWQVAPRLRVFGGYSEGISTFDQDQQNSLLDGSDATGVAASALQAAPLLGGSSFFGGNQNLNRVNRLNLSSSWLGDYDTLTLSVQRETTTPVGRQIGLFPAYATSGAFGNINEVHQLTDTLSVTGFVQYGTNSNGLGGSGSGDTVSFSAGIEKSFPRLLSAYLRVGGTYYVGGNAFAAAGYAGQSGNVSTIIIGGMKKF